MQPNQLVVFPPRRGGFYSNTIIPGLLLFVVLFLPFEVFASTNVGGRISTNTAWTLAGSPYVVTSSVQFYGTTTGVPITLTIEPGVVVKFQTGTYLQIANDPYPAVLNAVGTTEAPIIFTSYKDDTAGGDTNGDGSATSPAPGNWNYIYLWRGSSASVLDHTEVRYGGSGGQGDIYIFESSPTIQNSVITQSSNIGISIFTQTVSSAPNILNNQITQNATYGIKTTSTYGSTPVSGLIQGNAITGSGQYGVRFEGVIGATIQNNQISMGVYFTSSNGSPVLTGNVISDLGSVQAQVPADILNAFLSQNTLQGIGPTTALNVLGDTITGTTALTTQFYSYVVSGSSINVRGTTGNPSTLVIQSGVRMAFASAVGINVGSTTSTPGILQVQGTSGSPVLFTKSGSSAWSGINLDMGTVGAQTSLQYATIEYAGNGTSPATAQLYVNYNNATLDHVTVQNGTASGILMAGASPTMTAVTVSPMGADGISINGASGYTTAPTITQATVSNAGRYGIYINATYGVIGGSVQGSTVLNPGQYGIYATVSYAVNTTIQNNQIARGIYYTSSVGSPVLTGNVISDLGSVQAQVPADILNAFLTQNTLQGIGPTTSLNVTGDTITGTTTLTTQFYSYVVTSGTINVNGTTGNPSTLVIQAGVRMSFASSTGISVGSSTSTPGILQVQGTLEFPVLFTKSGSSAWSGITLSNGTVGAQTNLQYATIEYAGNGTSPSTAQLYINFASPTLDHVTVQNGTASGIIVTGGSPTMTSVTVNQMGSDGISINGSSGYTTAPAISQATVSSAGRYGIYINATYGVIGGSVQGSIISNSGQYGVYCTVSYAVNTSVQNNQIGKGLYFTGSVGSPVLIGNVISDLGSVTAQVPADILNAFLTQNTLQGIGPTTSLNVTGDTITGTTTLTTQFYSYVVTSGTINVNGTTGNPSTLVIQGGVRMLFGSSVGISVGSSTSTPGILQVQGTSGSPVLFTKSGSSAWSGISLYSGTVGAQTSLQYATIEYASVGTSPSTGQLNISYSSPTLDHVTVQNGTASGIIVTGGSPTMTSVTVNQMGSDGISINGSSSYTTTPAISQTTVSNAGRYGIYISANYGIVGGSIQGSTISNSGQYGIYATVSYAVNTSVQNNQIAKGIYFTGGAGSPVLTGNVISDLGSVTVQVPADILNAFLNQNTLQGIGPTTTLNVTGDTITGTTTLTTQFYGYVVTSGSINVRGTTGNPSTLVIQAGVRMSFGSGMGISVASSTSTPGILQVQGTSEAPVLFTKSGSGSWSGISLDTGTVGTETYLQYAIIEYGGTGTDPNNASLRIYSNNPTLQNVTVRYSGPSGIYLYSASPVMTAITIDQVGGDGITIPYGPSMPTISQSLIKNAGRYGIYMAGSTTTPLIENSVIETPVDYGLYISSAIPTVLNSTIDKNLFMANANGLPTFTGNTFKNFNTKTGRIAIALLQSFQTQNTLLNIDPATVLELNGDPALATDTTIGLYWKIYNVVAGNISVGGSGSGPPVILTIKPGVTIRFAASMYLGVGTGSRKGVLVARGTSVEPILLTTLNASPNNWRGIVFSTNAVPGASLLEYVTVDQGGKVNAAVDATYTAFTMNHCIVRNSTMHGIQLTSSDLNMQFSQVYSNSQRGLYIPTSGSSDNSRVTIRNGDFYSNTQGAILNEQSTLSVDARNVWWGNASGPGGSGPGTGNSVSTKVLYDPWLGTAFTYPFAVTNGYSSASSFTQGGGTTTLAGELTQNASWTVVVKNSSSTTMMSDSGSGRLVNTTWDGTDTSSTPQPNGTYTFQMDATSGSNSAAPIIGRVVLDNSLPTAIITDPSPSELVLTSPVTIAGTASASSFSSYTVDVGLGTSPFQFITLATSSSPVINGPLATWTVQSNPPSGYYQIRLKVTGPVGTTAETTRLVRIDHTPPLPPQIQQPASPTATQPIMMTGIAEPDTNVELYVNDLSSGQVTAASDGTFNFSSVSLGLGSNALKARATDAAGNVGSFSDKKSVVYLPSGETLIHILSPADGGTVYK